MIEYRVIDIEKYPRNAHLEYFMTMERPHLNITANVDITDLKEFCRSENCSFFLAFLHVVDISAESIPEFRQRLHRLSGDEYEIREYAECPTSHTERVDNEMYAYCPIHHHMPWDEYIRQATELQQAAREHGTLDEDPDIEAFFFPTCLPWIHYSDAVHPMVDRFDSNPRMSWGKYEEDFRGRLMMPLTIAAHHGLVDGIHIGRFYENVEKNMKALIEGTLEYQTEKGK